MTRFAFSDTRFLRAAACTALLLCAPLASRAAADEAPKKPPAANTADAAPYNAASKSAVTFNATTYADHVRYLASDELGGRRPGQPGIQLASEYIADIFKAAGCEPAGDNGTYFQEFEVPDGRKIAEEDAKLVIDGKPLKLHADWVPTPFNKDETVEGDLAFAGFGIDAEEFKYNDYDGFDAKDKILLILRYEPRDKDPKAEFGGSEKSKYSAFNSKAKKAADKGAKGLIVVDPPLPEPKDGKDELFKFNKRDSGSMELPLAHITRAAAEKLLKQAGMPDLKTLQEKLETDRKPLSADMKMKVTLAPAVRPNRTKTHNVLGMLKGDGSSDEVIVVGAHYDHLGTSPKQFNLSDEKTYIHNGADDNASGTSGVCELARAFGSQPRLHRNILFMTFSAEEMGLLGSAHFVNHPTIELKRIKAMYNMDMIGRYGQHKFEIYGIDTAEEFEPLIKRVTGERGVDYKFMSRSSGVFGQSDHASFYRKNIPVLFPFTGIHKQYHQPEDDWELIDHHGATLVLSMSYDIIHELASMKEGPKFIEKKKKADADEKKDGEKKDEKSEKKDEKDDAQKDDAAQKGAAGKKDAGDEKKSEKSDVKKDEKPQKKDEPKKADAKPGDAKKDDASKDDAKKDDTKRDDAKKDDAKKEDAKKDGDAPKDEKKDGDAPVRTRPGVRIGIMPGYADDGKPGMLVEGTIEGGAAEKAGIKEGDRIIKIGESKVSNIEEYMKALAGYKPGDTADVVVTRDGKEMTFKVTFTGGGGRPREKE